MLCMTTMCYEDEDLVYSEALGRKVPRMGCFADSTIDSEKFLAELARRKAEKKRNQPKETE